MERKSVNIGMTYYYAYWKDHESKKLKKKYIGDHMPTDKRSNDDSTNNQVL
jgi:hypothetical protein